MSRSDDVAHARDRRAGEAPVGAGGRRGALDALTAGLVDYAGLFPPAALAMREAVRAYAAHAAGPDRAMLARFVVPFARLDELARTVDALDAERRGPGMPGAGAPWRLSVLAGAAEAEAIAAWERAQGGRFAADTVEAKAETVEGIAAIAAAYASRSVPGASEVGGGPRAAEPAPGRGHPVPRTVFVEIPVRDDPAPLVAALAAHGLRAKIRTGGVTAEAFPAPAEVLRFLRACHAAGVPCKATAGLHHPLRGEYPLTYARDAPRGTMYGFLNISLAAALLARGADDATLLALLDERDPAALVVAPDAIGWRGHRLDTSALAEARRGLAGSFGSCSFDEPARELAAVLRG